MEHTDTDRIESTIAAALTRVAAVLVIAATTLATAGCNIIGPAYYFAVGPDKVNEVHTLEATRTTVIFVDDRDNRLPRRTLRFVVGESATKLLLENDALTKTPAGEVAAIDGRAAITAATRDRFGEPMSIAAIGNACSAEVVIHVVFESFTLSQDGSTFAPAARMRIKVIDAVNQKRLFPEGNDAVGYPVSVSLKQRTTDVPNSSGGVLAAQEALAKECGRAVAELFYEHRQMSTDRAKS